MKKFRAIRPMRYGTRRLMAGEIFDAPPAHGRLFVAIKKAEPVRDVAPLQPMPAKLKRKAAKKAKAAKTTATEPRDPDGEAPMDAAPAETQPEPMRFDPWAMPIEESQVTPEPVAEPADPTMEEGEIDETK